jgi:hypothetical protein
LRHFALADKISLKTMASAVLRLRHLDTLAMGWVELGNSCRHVEILKFQKLKFAGGLVCHKGGGRAAPGGWGAPGRGSAFVAAVPVRRDTMRQA